MAEERIDFRPKTIDSFFGQENIKEQLKVYMFGSKKVGKPLSHILLCGPSGMGKTTLGHIIANEMNTNIKTINAPMITTNQELIEIIASIKEGEILFIDEIHRLDKKIEEVLYSVLEDFKMTIPYKSDEQIKVVQIDVPKFTLIGATTLEGLISIPLRDRFQLNFHFKEYSEIELSKLLHTNTEKVNLKFESFETSQFFIQRCKGNPRILNNLLLKLTDYATYYDRQTITLEFLHKFFKFIKIDDYGLDEFDKAIIKVMYENFPSQPVSLDSIASLINENPVNLKENYEPYLVRAGMIRRTRSGRLLTDRGKLFYWNNIHSLEK